MRVIAVVTLFIIALFSPYWVFMLAATLYALWRTGYELIIIGVLIDAQFGGNVTYWFLYTLSTGVLVIAAEFIKPHLRFYDPESL